MRSPYGRAPHRRRQFFGFAAGVLAIVVAVGGLVAVRKVQEHRESAAFVASSDSVFTQRAVDIESTPSEQGYWMASADGGVFTYGDAQFYGSAGAWNLAAPVLDMAPRPDGSGYWLVGADGGVFSFGASTYYGSLAGAALNGPVASIVSTPSGNGYWLVATDGGVFAFGDAVFYGSAASTPLSAPVISMTPTPSGNGYWLAGTDGGVFAFGDAVFYGSAGGIRLAAPVLGIEANGSGNGYWLFASDGGVFAYGDAPFYGSGTTFGIAGFTGLSASASGSAYWLAGNDGSVIAFDAAGAKIVGPPLLAPAPPSSSGGPTGPSNRAALQATGSLTITTDGAVVENVDVNGEIRVAAANVTIRNFRANNVVHECCGGLVLEDGEIHGEQDPFADGVTGSNYTVRRLDIHNVVDAFKAGTNTIIENSWIHDLNFVNFGDGSWTHNDGVQIMGGSNIVIRNNVFERNRGNAAIFIDPDFGVIDDVVVENNILGGGGFTLYSVPSPKAPQFGVPSNVRIRNNVFIEEHLFDYATATPGSGWVWEGNTNTSGQIISPRPW
jgi:hypothetical protein